MCKQLPPELSSQNLRRPLAQCPTGVAVATTVDASGRTIGMTINSFHSASLMPALIGWSIARQSPNYAVFANAERFAISVLNEGQAELAQHFATGRVVDLAQVSASNDAPAIIADSSAWFKCATYNRFLICDHLLMIGRITESYSRNIAPLVFTQGEYNNLSKPNFSGATVKA